MTRAAAVTVAAILFATLAGCAGGVPTERPSALRLRPPDPTPWREDFGDPVLHDILRRVDLENLDIKSALARLEIADAGAALAHAERVPRVQIGAAGAVGGATFSRSLIAASPTLEAVYDIDLWGGLRQGEAAARSESLAAEADVAGARRLVAAQTVTAYVALRSAQDLRASIDRRAEILSGRRNLVRARAANGAAGADAVIQAEAALAGTIDAKRDADDEVLVQSRRLQALVGSMAGLDLRPTAGFDLQIPALLGAAASGDVDARPEVRAAFARLGAADARRAQAIAATRPQFQIVAALGAPDAAISTLLDVRALAWAVAGALTHTIVDGGAAHARVAQSGGEADVAELTWRKAVLDGWIDMQTAITREASARAAVDAAAARLDQRRAGLAIVELRHREGVVDGIATADARIAVEEAAAALAEARAQALVAWVQWRLAEGAI